MPESSTNLTFYEKIYLEYFNKLVAINIKNNVPESDAQDIVADIFERLLKKDPSSLKMETLENLLLRINTNARRDFYRKKKSYKKYRKSLQEFEDTETIIGEQPVHKPPNPEEELIFSERVENAKQAINQEMMRAFELQYVDGLPQEEVARQLNISVSTLKGRIFRAQKNIQSLEIES